MGRTTEKGSLAPPIRRRPIIVVGRRLAEEVLSTAKVIISREAAAGSPPRLMLSECSFFIAESASGVAALPIPRRFAPMQAEISSLPSPLL